MCDAHACADTPGYIYKDNLGFFPLTLWWCKAKCENKVNYTWLLCTVHWNLQNIFQVDTEEVQNHIFFREKQTITDPDLLPLSKIITPVTHWFNKGHSVKRISRL